jgi:hypothetical protein
MKEKICKWIKKNRADITIMVFIVLGVFALGTCGVYSTRHADATVKLMVPRFKVIENHKEVCPEWDIQPPVLCDTEHIFDAYDKAFNVYFISGFEAFQMCSDGTGVLWVWGGTLPRNERDAWIPTSSLSPKNAKIYLNCFVKGNNEACDDFAEIINEIIDCNARNYREEN